MNNKYYITDKLLGNKPVTFDSVNEVVSVLEQIVQRKMKLTRKQYMQNLIDLGYGADDPAGRTFTESMAEHVEIGVIKNNRYVRCNIHEASHYSKYLTEMGD